jgi:predicted nucleic-acid-binding protein
MIGLDTNILVRYLTQDDPVQARKATRRIEEGLAGGETFFISGIVLCELVWVLEDVYDYPRRTIAEVLEKVLRTGQFAFEDKELAWQALADYQGGKGDFSDYLIGRTAHQGGCDHTITFDTALKNHRLFKVI